MCCTHQAQQVEEQVCVFADQVVRLAAKIHKVVEAAGRFVSSVDDERHVRGENKGGAVSAEQTREGGGVIIRTRLLSGLKLTKGCSFPGISKTAGSSHRLMFPNIWACPRNFPKSMWNM